MDRVGAWRTDEELIIMITAAAEFGGSLGSACQLDQDCTTQNSRCNHGTCACLPYYATYNSSQCLQCKVFFLDY
uniref:EB domain-containing protein n=1 Tax=Rhodnius prolixus TaxID=13249 RepID=T1HP29_RHOPR